MSALDHIGRQWREERVLAPESVIAAIAALDSRVSSLERRCGSTQTSHMPFERCSTGAVGASSDWAATPGAGNGSQRPGVPSAGFALAYWMPL